MARRDDQAVKTLPLKNRGSTAGSTVNEPTAKEGIDARRNFLSRNINDY